MRVPARVGKRKGWGAVKSWEALGNDRTAPYTTQNREIPDRVSPMPKRQQLPQNRRLSRPSKRGSWHKQVTKSGVARNGAQASGIAGRCLAIEHRALDDLIPYGRNARTHSKTQVAQIAASIREFGWTNPILVDRKNGVIAGHGRLLAAQELGLRTVPVIELANLSEAQRRAYVLADNKLALNAGWDDNLLAAEVVDLVALGFDLSTTGFSVGEIDSLLSQSATSSFPDEAPAPPPKPVTRAGDLWTLEDHRLLCGDATKGADLERALGDRAADMVFADPPYNVAYEGKTAKRMRIENDALGSGFGPFLQAACREMLQACQGSFYVCMSSSQLALLKSAFEAGGGHWSTFIIWSKTAFTLGRSDYQRQYEPILYGWHKGTKRYWCGARDQGDIWSFDRPARNDLHPTMKPVALVERAIRNSSKPGATILDPFAGSGTTLMAAEASGRRAALLEIDPGYCDVILSRWHDQTGKSAVRQDGIKFRQLSPPSKSTAEAVRDAGS
jgi:DNA modification methylase